MRALPGLLTEEVRITEFGAPGAGFAVDGERSWETNWITEFIRRVLTPDTLKVALVLSR